MPGYDKTGPRGDGHMTGRALGYCAPERRYSQRQKRYSASISREEDQGEREGDLERKASLEIDPRSVEGRLYGTGLGPCGNGVPRGMGRGDGYGRGRGRFFRHGRRGL